VTGVDLDALDPGRVLACPDGSVDTFVHVRDGDERLTDRATFRSRIADGERSFRFVPQRVAPGGQAVNVAQQAATLGATPTVFGHCDDPVFRLPFRVESLGDPAQVTVCSFEGGDLMLATDSRDLATCGAERLAAAGAYDATPDVVCVSNAVSVPHVDEVLGGFGSGDAPVVFDPGPITGISPERAERLRDALRALGDRRRVVVSPNREETRAFADALGIEGEVAAMVPTLRRRLGVDAVVVHSAPTTFVTTGEGVTAVETPSIEVAARTGGGDCFVGGLACALASDWSVRESARLGTGCAAHRVATGEIPDRSAVAARL
jgi:sugar/nucleoside kinase (ribokinase family)